MKPKRIFPSKEKLITNREFYKNKRLKYRGRSMVFDKDIKTGVCHFCDTSNKEKKYTRTVLHHLKYRDSNPLAWTIEICPSCHYKVDPKNKTRIDMYYDKKKKV